MKRGRSKKTAKRIAAATVRKGQKRNPDTCNTCGKPADQPYRQYDSRGKVTAGCIDDFHTGHLITPSESARWHNRPQAKKWRAAQKKRLKEMMRGSKRNPSMKGAASKAKTALKTTGKALKTGAREVLKAGSDILGAGAKALNPAKKFNDWSISKLRQHRGEVEAFIRQMERNKTKGQTGTKAYIDSAKRRLAAIDRAIASYARRKNKTTIKVQRAVIVAPNKSRTRNAYRIPPEAIKKFPQHMQDEYWKHWGDLEKREEKAATPKQKAAVKKAKRGFLSRLAVKARAFSQSRKYKVRARHLAKAPIKIIKVRSTSADGALAKAKAKLGSGYDQFKVQNKTIHRTGNPTFTIGARARLNPRKRNLDHKDSSHQVEVRKHWRAGGLSQWQRAHHAGQHDLFAHGIKAKAKRNPPALMYLTEHDAPTAKLRSLLKRHRIVNEKMNALKDERRYSGHGTSRSLRLDKQIAVLDRKHRHLLRAEENEYGAYLRKASKKNPSAESIRKEFAGSVSGSRDLYFPQGTPQGLAKLGKLVSIKTEEGTLKPVSGTAWLCADTNGHLHIGTTQNKPLWDGSAHSFGQVCEVEYEASKPHLGFPNPITFYHKLGEETGHKPTLRADGKGGLKFHGGRYRITREGIVN